MLTCRDLCYQADAYLDGELSGWKRLRARLHLSMCNGCSRFMGQMRSTRSLVMAEAGVADTREDARLDCLLAVLHTKYQTRG